MIKVSIICRTYNQEDWIEGAIQSALNQTFQDFELIIVDDSSTDNTPTKIASFNDPRIISIRNQNNLGHIENLNLGIHMSKGEYLCILDGDDTFEPTKLEKQVDFLDNNPDYGAVFTHMNTIGDKSNSKVLKNCKKFEELLNRPTKTKAEMFRNCFGIDTFLIFPSEMFRREFAFYWPNHLLGLSETNFHLSMLLKTKVKVLEEPLVNYRVGEDYSSKWANPVSLQSELFFILDRFLEIDSTDLFKEVFKNELAEINLPIEKELLPYILTVIAENSGDEMKISWANYNFHRFISKPSNAKMLKDKLNLSYVDFFRIKKGVMPSNSTSQAYRMSKKVKKYKSLSLWFFITSVIFCLTTIFLMLKP